LSPYRVCSPKQWKLVVAAKSPLTGGYGDGNVGSHVAVQIRKAGYDAIIVEGKALVVVGSGELQAAYPKEPKELGAEAYREVLNALLFAGFHGLS